MEDIIIIGGGIIGASTAYFLSKEGRKVKVIERDPTYKKASFPLSLGGFRRQFYQKENILLGKFAREFIFQIPELLKTEKNPNPTASMVPNGYLLMFGPLWAWLFINEIPPSSVLLGGAIIIFSILFQTFLSKKQA